MAFRFLCPQGHLLQAEESQAGQQSQCPSCGSVFLIPRPTAPPEAGFETPPQQAPAPEVPPFQFPDVQTPRFEQPAVEPPPRQPPDAEPPTLPPPMVETQAEAGVPDFPGIRTGPRGEGGHVAAEVPSQLKPPAAAELPIVHVPCPNGHRLETPREMLGQEALCPFCQVQFRLRLEDSIEYREEKAKELQRREARRGQLWLRWAIAAAVVVVFGLTLLIVLSASR